jgi:hypothetical protein
MKKNKLTRRDFLKVASVTSAGLVLSACGVDVTKLPDPTATAIPSLTPFPTITNTPVPTVTPTPALPTLRDVGDKLNLLIGTSVDGAEEYRTPAYQKATTHFSLLVPSGSFLQLVQDDWGTGMAKGFRTAANQNHQAFYIMHAFWHQDVQESLKSASNDEILAYMKSRIEFLLGFVEKVDSEHLPTYINLINEPIWYWQGNSGWEQSPYYKVFGQKLLPEIYLMFAEMSEKENVKLGQDFYLVYNDYDIYRKGGKRDFAFDILSRAKSDIAKSLGIADSQVPLEIGLQYRFNPTLDTKTHLYDDLGFFPIPTDDETYDNLQKFSEVANIHITEFEVRGNGSEIQKQRIEIYNRLSMVAKNFKAVKSIAYFGTFRNQPNSPQNFSYNGLFDKSYQPTADYYSLLDSISKQ